MVLLTIKLVDLLGVFGNVENFAFFENFHEQGHQIEQILVIELFGHQTTCIAFNFL